LPLVLKTQTKKKLKKLYLDKCSSGVLFPKSILNASRIKSLLVFTFLLSLTFFTHINAQESIITGLENIHISEGATIVTIENGESKINYSSVSTPINKKNSKISTSTKKEIKEKIAFSQKKKTPKAIDEKLLKKLEQKREVKIIYNTDAQSEECLSSNYRTSKSGINNQNQSQKLDKALFTENKPLVFLFIYQEKQNVLFQFYHSLKVENHHFTRPPPTFI
jgi:hypothetical protein